jgi:hypothetical protein
VSDLRAAIAAGARPQWPRSLPVPDDATYTWFILTPNVLPALPLDDRGIAVRSHQMLASFRWQGEAVADMVDALMNPPPPPSGFDTTNWVHLRYGPFHVRVGVAARLTGRVSLKRRGARGRIAGFLDHFIPPQSNKHN